MTKSFRSSLELRFWVLASFVLVAACGRSDPTHTQPLPTSAVASAPPPTATVDAPLGTSRRPDTEALPFFTEATFTPRWLSPGSKEAVALPRVATFALTNQEGEEISSKAFEGKVYVADFFFTTCPGICTRMTKNMRKLQDAFLDEPDVLLISHTVTPDVDDVPRLAAYAKKHGVRAGKWHLVTGDVAEIYRLGRRSYFLDEKQGDKPPETEFLHTENFVLVDRHGRMRGIYNGLNNASMQQLARDIEYLLTEG